MNDEKIKIFLNGKSYSVTLSDLEQAYQIPNKGNRIARKADLKKVPDYNKKKFKREVTENPKLAKNEHISFATLKTDLRIAHKFITYFLTPKARSYDYVSSLELCLM